MSAGSRVRMGLCSMAAAMCLVGVASAEPMTDEQLEAVLADFRAQREELFAGGSPTADQYRALFDEALAKIDIASLTAAQIATLNGEHLLDMSPEARRAAVDRLNALPMTDDAEGAALAVTKLSLAGRSAGDAEAQAEMLRQTLTHPALDEFIKSGGGRKVFAAVRNVGNPDAYRAAREEVLSLLDRLDDDLPADTALAFESYMGVLDSFWEDPADPARQQARAALVAHARRVSEQAAAGENDLDEETKGFLDRMIARLDGAAARGELLNHQAPGLDFVWSSDPELQSLDDLKGRVVILDFWATWCGPCVGSIPNVRELAAYYNGYPVTIVGVTSVQGTHYGPDGAVECEGDPQKEFALMAEYIRQKEITWPIVFSEQEVFNPDYGVRGIPHVVILDPQGRVRHTGLHPARPLNEKVEKIDALLKEAGLPTPAPAEG